MCRVDADVEDELSSTDDSASEDNSDSNRPNENELCGNGESNATTEEVQGSKRKKEDLLTSNAAKTKENTEGKIKETGVSHEA